MDSENFFRNNYSTTFDNNNDRICYAVDCYDAIDDFSVLFLKWVSENDYRYSRKFKKWQKSFINETLFYSEKDLLLIYSNEKKEV